MMLGMPKPSTRITLEQWGGCGAAGHRPETVVAQFYVSAVARRAA
jgi:hypothetical protein